MPKKKRGRGSVRYRKEIRKYVIDYRDKRGKRHVETIGEDREEAEKVLTQRLYDIDIGRFNYKPKEKNFENYVTEWIKRKTDIKALTLKSYRSYIKRHFIPYFGKKMIHEITRDDIHGFIKSLMDIKKSAKTIHNIVTTLRQILDDAVIEGYIEKNPYIKIAKPKVMKPEVDAFDIGEVNLLLQTLKKMKDKYYLVIRMAVETGLRQGEQLGLMWIDFDWQSNQVYVRRSYYRGQFTTPKSRKSIRRVDLTDELVSELKAYRHLKGDLVFCTEDGKGLNTRNLVEHFNRALRKAGLRRIRWHDLRHTNVSLRIASEQNIKYISEQLGHSSIKITLDTYGHILPTNRKNQKNRLQNYLYGNIMVTEAAK